MGIGGRLINHRAKNWLGKPGLFHWWINATMAIKRPETGRHASIVDFGYVCTTTGKRGVFIILSVVSILFLPSAPLCHGGL